MKLDLAKGAVLAIPAILAILFLAYPAEAFYVYIFDGTWAIAIEGGDVVKPDSIVRYRVYGELSAGISGVRAKLVVYVFVNTTGGWIQVYSDYVLPDSVYSGSVTFDKTFSVHIPKDAILNNPVYFYLETHTRAWGAAVSIVQDPPYDRLKRDYEELKSAYDKLKRDYDKLREDYEKLQKDYGALKVAYEMLKTDYEKLLASHITLQANYSKLKSDYETLRESYEKLRISYENLQANYGKLKSDYETLMSTYNRLKTDHDKLTVEYGTLTANYNVLKSDYDKLNRDYGSLQASHNTLQSSYEKLKAEYEETANRLQSTTNMMYAFAGIAAVLAIGIIAITVYFMRRKSAK